jgi:hypothetical protein
LRFVELWESRILNFIYRRSLMRDVLRDAPTKRMMGDKAETARGPFIEEKEHLICSACLLTVRTFCQPMTAAIPQAKNRATLLGSGTVLVVPLTMAVKPNVVSVASAMRVPPLNGSPSYHSAQGEVTAVDEPDRRGRVPL